MCLFVRMSAFSDRCGKNSDDRCEIVAIADRPLSRLKCYFDLKCVATLHMKEISL